jgi:hypothetical protein
MSFSKETAMFELQEMGGERAKMILEDLLIELSDMDVSDMTTFELGILHRCAKNPPKEKTRVEPACGSSRQACGEEGEDEP